jgi:uncharacterized membrane protein YgcG
MTTFIVIWLVCGFIAAAIAHSKKLNVAAWLLIGAVLGFFAIVLVLFQAAPPQSPSVWSSGRDSGSGGGYGGHWGGGGGCGGGGI